MGAYWPKVKAYESELAFVCESKDCHSKPTVLAKLQPLALLSETHATCPPREPKTIVCTWLCTLVSKTYAAAGLLNPSGPFCYPSEYFRLPCQLGLVCKALQIRRGSPVRPARPLDKGLEGLETSLSQIQCVQAHSLHEAQWRVNVVSCSGSSHNFNLCVASLFLSTAPRSRKPLLERRISTEL